MKKDLNGTFPLYKNISNCQRKKEELILLNRNFLKEIMKFDLVMFGDEKSKTQNIGFIFATKDSIIIDEWLKKIIINVQIYKRKISDKKLETNKKILKWNYLGNGIVDKLLKNVKGKIFYRINRNKVNALPEINFFMNYSFSKFQSYNNLYFQNRDPEIILNNTKNIILLHNSWTPSKYKAMSEKEFLKQNILLSKLLNKILYKSI